MSYEYFDDKHITDPDNDLLNRKCFAQSLAKSILNLQTNSTFTIGLYGAWGSGKTSIVNLIENEIQFQQSEAETNDDEKLIIVRFEPWNFASCEQLLSQFFIRLSNELDKICNKKGKKDKILQKLGEALETYSEAFVLTETIPVVGKLASILLKNGVKYLGNKLKRKPDLYSQKKAIEGILNGQKHRILIIIDDVDRLSNDQIRQVFQLINSVANFPKMRYLVVFDKNIVVKALSKVQEGSGEAYLEKIIQMPIEVPQPSKVRLAGIMQQDLKSIYETYYHSSFDNAQFSKLYEICFEPFIKSVRDINRICNSLSVKFAAIASEVNFADMTVLTTIQVLFPPAYEWIKRDGILSPRQLIKTIHQNDTPRITDEEIKGWLKILEYPEEDFENLVDGIKFCLRYLFPDMAIENQGNYIVYNANEMLINNRICIHSKFDRYFNLDLNSVAVTQSDILELLNEVSSEQIKIIFKTHFSKGTIMELFDETSARINSINSEHAQTIELAALDFYYEVYLQGNVIDSTFYCGYESFSYNLLKRIEQNRRLQFISNILENMNFERALSFLPTLRYIEMDYGKFEGEYRKESVINEDELNKIERALCKRVNDYLKTHNLYEVTGWWKLVYMLKTIEPDYIDNYIMNSYCAPQNILKFLLGSSITPYGIDNLYEIREDNYSEYLTKDQILNAITELRNAKEFYKLPQELKETAAIFDCHFKKLSTNDYIAFKDIKETLDAWEAEDGITK